MPHVTLLLIRATLIALVSAVAVIDLCTHRIPNLLTVPGALLGVALNGAASGGAGIVVACVGLLLGMALFLPFFLVGHVGAGDVKAIAAIGAFVGGHGTLIAVMWILMAGGIAAAGVVLVSRLRHQTCAQAPHSFPYGIAIACGTLAALGWSGA